MNFIKQTAELISKLEKGIPSQHNILDELNYCTARLVCQKTNGTMSYGSAFIYEYEPNCPILITNKHVIENIDSGYFILCNSHEDGTPNDEDHLHLAFLKEHAKFKYHPDNNVDLCAMQIGSFLNACTAQGKKPFFRSFNEGHIPKSNIVDNIFTTLQTVFMIGYPRGLWDEKNNKPIIRKGITASKFSQDYNGRQEFLLDINCIHGSSGSPVVAYEEIVFQDEQKNLQRTPQLFLLGILWAGAMMDINGIIKSIKIPTEWDDNVESLHLDNNKLKIPINIGYAIKSKRILELAELFDPKEQIPITMRKPKS